MPNRVNRAIELLAEGQPVYYTGPHAGHVLTYAQGTEDATTWADYINVGMERGAFGMADLDEYLLGPVDGGPTRSGHRTPALHNIEEILAVPGIGFAEMGPGDLSLSLGLSQDAAALA